MLRMMLFESSDIEFCWLKHSASCSHVKRARPERGFVNQLIRVVKSGVHSAGLHYWRWRLWDSIRGSVTTLCSFKSWGSLVTPFSVTWVIQMYKMVHCETISEFKWYVTGVRTCNHWHRMNLAYMTIYHMLRLSIHGNVPYQQQHPLSLLFLCIWAQND